MRPVKLDGRDAHVAIAAAREAGLPVLEGSEPSVDPGVLVEAAQGIGFPIFVKAVSGGGGRGMRRVDDPEKLPAAMLVDSPVLLS